MKIRRIFLYLFFGLLYQNFTFATIIESAGSGNWNVAATWANNSVPGASDTAVIKSGHIVQVTSPHSITGINVENGATLIVDGNGSLTSLGNITQDGTFTVNGTLNLKGGIHQINVANSFSGTGSLNIADGFTVTMNGATWAPAISNISLVGTLNGDVAFTIPMGTTLTWAWGTFGLINPITNDGTITIQQHNYVYEHNTSSNIINNGTFNWNHGHFDFGGGINTFINNGIFISSSNASTCKMDFENNGTTTLNSGIFTENITNNTGKTISIGNGADVTTFGNITQNGNFTLNGTLNMKGGTHLINVANSFSGTGSLNIADGFTVTMNGATWAPAITNISLVGTLNGDVAFTIPMGTTLTWHWGAFGLINPITNDGIITIQQHNYVYEHNTSSNIINNGTFNWNHGHLDFGGGINTFINNGIFISSSNASTCKMDFENNGTTTLNSGIFTENITNNTGKTISIGNGADVTTYGNITLNGNFTLNGTLNMKGGTHLIYVANSFSGTGSLNIADGFTVTMNGATWASAITNISLVGTLNGDVAFTIPMGTTLTWHWGAFGLINPITNDGIITIQQHNYVYEHNTSSNIINNGTFNWNHGHLDFSGGGKTFTNNGIFISSSNTNTCKMIFDNNGTSTLISGTFTENIINQLGKSITIPIDGLVTSTYNITQGGNFIINGTLNASNGTIDINTANSFSGTGTLGFNYPTTINLNSAWTPTLSTINLNSAIINGTGSITVASGKTLTIGDTWFNNSTTLTNNGTFNINGGYSHNFVGDIINSATGTLNWNGGNLDGAGGFQTLTNNGIMNVTGSPTISYLDITNSGTLNTTVDCEFGATASFTNQSAGILNAQSGIAKFSNNLTNNGTLKGNGKVNISYIPFTGSGNVSPGASPGTLSIIGDYTNSILNIEINTSMGVVTKDSLYVSGNVTLGGTLNVTETGNAPSGNYIFLKTGGWITGSFSSINIPDCYTLEIDQDKITLKKGIAKIWDGTVNTWDQDNHWNPVGVPCPLDNVIINSGECNLNIQPDMKSLTINGGALKKIDAATYAINVKTTVAAAGTINVFAGTLDINDTLDNNGTIQGYANIDLINATVIGGYGKWAPGNSTGVLDAKGTYNNEVIEMEIGGNGGGVGTVELDKLNVSQTMVVGGNLDLLWLGGTIPVGTRTLMECAGGANCRTGSFGTINLPPQCPPGKCNIIYTGTEVRLENTEPIEFKGSCTWLGGTGNWSTVAKWSCNDVPNSNDDVIINSGNVTVDNPTTVKTMVLGQNAILSGNKSLTISGALSWTGGDINIENDVTVGGATISGNVSVSGGNLILGEGGTVENAQLMLKNQAILTIPADKTLNLNYSNAGSLTTTGSASIINNGNLNKTGDENLDIFPAFINNGIFKIAGGTASFKNNLTNNNVIKGTGTLNLTAANILNMGAVAPGNSPGTINIIGNYPNKKIIIEILESGGVTSYDKLIASGDVILTPNDELVIDHLGGIINYANYTNILSCTGGPDCRKETFNTVTYPPFCAGECSIEYLATSVNLIYEKQLPVELAYFTGRLVGKETILNWTTLSEENAATFDIMRSANGNEWVYLGEIAANGTTSSTHDYSFIDTDPLAGENYYRLKQHDLDGSIYYTKVIRVQTPIKKSWKLFPNPVQDILEVRFSNNEDGILQIFDATGRLVLKQELQSEKSISVDLSNLNSGLYWVQMTGFKTEMVVKY